MKQLSSLVDLLQYRASHAPDNNAFTFLLDGENEKAIFTYSTLEKKVKTIAAKLQQSLNKGDKALLLYAPGPEYIAAFFGCLYAGVIPVPAYPPARKSLEKLENIAQDSQAVMALSTSDIITKLTFLKQKERVNGWLQKGFKLFKAGQNEPTEAKYDIHAIEWMGTDKLDEELANDWQKPNITEDDIAFFQYTSGSTNKPKGVVLTHKNLLSNSKLIKQYFNFNEDSHMVSWLPPYHDMGLIGSILQSFYSGIPLTAMSPMSFLKKPFRWLKAISEAKGVVVSGSPNFAYDLCVRKVTPEQLAELDLSHWKVAFNGAEPVRNESLQRFAAKFAPCGFKTEYFFPVYGLAEGTLLVSAGDTKALPIVSKFEKEQLEKHKAIPQKLVSPHNTAELVACGTQIVGQEIKIVNPDTHVVCEPNEIGEIWLQGPSIAQGYWQKPALNAKIFQAHLAGDTQAGPHFRTGDLGFFKDGQLYITGRLKDVLIIRGRNYYPQDIELTVERSHDALRKGCGASFTVDVQGAEKLIIVQEIKRTHRKTASVNEIINAISKEVSMQHALKPYMVSLIATSSIPKTSSGKIRRFECRNQFLNGKLNKIA